MQNSQSFSYTFTIKTYEICLKVFSYLKNLEDTFIVHYQYPEPQRTEKNLRDMEYFLA